MPPGADDGVRSRTGNTELGKSTSFCFCMGNEGSKVDEKALSKESQLSVEEVCGDL